MSVRRPERLAAAPHPTAGERDIEIGRDAVGNVVITGDGNEVPGTIVVADQRLLASFREGHGAGEAVENPYRGLDAFYETDGHWFFGRRRLVARAWTQFQGLQNGREPRILAVVGASGSGKSSLVRA